jgi:hypothetical protein
MRRVQWAQRSDAIEATLANDAGRHECTFLAFAIARVAFDRVTPPRVPPISLARRSDRSTLTA